LEKYNHCEIEWNIMNNFEVCLSVYFGKLINYSNESNIIEYDKKFLNENKEFWNKVNEKLNK
jgi:hypothetical protein